MSNPNSIEDARVIILCVLALSSILTNPFFTENADAASPNFTFTAAGDFGYGGDTLANFQAIGGSGAAFHLVLGDLSYGDTTEQDWCDTFHQSQPSVFVVPGNHDTHESGGGNMENYRLYCPFTLSGLDSGSGVAGSGYGYEYYFDYPSAGPLVRFIGTCAGVDLVNIGAGTCLYTPGSQRHTWLSGAIDQAKNLGWWVVVFSHKEYVSTGPYGGDSGKEYYDLLLGKKVDLILMGHDHTYQRSKLLSCCFEESTGFDPSRVLEPGPNYTRGLGSVNVIAGTGGNGLYTIDTADSDNQYFETWNGDNIGTTYGYAKFVVSSTSITGTFEPVSGGSFTDSFSISSCTGPCPPPTGGGWPFSIPPIIWLLLGIAAGVGIPLAVFRIRRHKPKHDIQIVGTASSET